MYLSYRDKLSKNIVRGTNYKNKKGQKLFCIKNNFSEEVQASEIIDLYLISYWCFVSYLSEANFGDGENGSNSVIGSVCFRVSGYCSLVVRRASPFTRLSRKSEWLICAKKILKRIRKERNVNCVHSLYCGVEQFLVVKITWKESCGRKSNKLTMTNILSSEQKEKTPSPLVVLSSTWSFVASSTS